MKMKATADTCPYCSQRHTRDYRCEAELEAWETDYDLREKEDYAGLIAHYKTILDWRCDGTEELQRLGEAYVLNDEPDKAIELLSEAHRQHPSDMGFQYLILEALFAMGKNETDFDWVEQMPVYRLDASVLDGYHAYLKTKCNPRTVFDLHDRHDGFCVFTPEELLEAIRRDERFVVEDEDFWSPGIRTRREDGVRTKGDETMSSRERWKLWADGSYSKLRKGLKAVILAIVGSKIRRSSEESRSLLALPNETRRSKATRGSR